MDNGGLNIYLAHIVMHQFSSTRFTDIRANPSFKNRKTH